MKNAKNYLYVLPAVIIIAVFFISSVLFTLYISFYEWDGFSPMVFVGLSNYSKLFTDANFKVSALNTIIWVVMSLIVAVTFPLILAVLITRSSRLSLFKNVFYFPSVLSGTVGGVIISAMVSIYGIPQLLGMMGFPSMVKDWLAVPYANTFLMIAMSVWQGIGMNLILYISGITSMPASPLEAAKIDGIGPIQLYTSVVFPLMKPTFVVVLTMTVVNSFKIFDSIWVMTKGGPFRSSETLALTMYQETFIYNRYGYGAAIAIILSVVILIVSYINLRNTFKQEG